MPSRPSNLRDSPRFDRSHWPQTWTEKHRAQVADFFCGKGGVGRALDSWFPRYMYFGSDIEDYSDEYPGEFVQADLINNRPFDGVVADLIWVSFPCTAYSSLSATHYGSAEAALEQNPRITDELREWLLKSGGHYVIENVPRATYVGDLDANCRVNGLAFGEDYDLTRHFETTFDVPDAYVAGTPDVTVDTRDDQSIEELAAAKNVPTSWGKQSVRSAIPWHYVWWIISHCPSVPCPSPKKVQQSFDVFTGNVGVYHKLPQGRLGGTDVAPGDELNTAHKSTH